MRQAHHVQPGEAFRQRRDDWREFLPGAPSPTEDVLFVGEGFPQRRFVILVPEFYSVQTSADRPTDEAGHLDPDGVVQPQDSVGPSDHKRSSFAVLQLDGPGGPRDELPDIFEERLAWGPVGAVVQAVYLNPRALQNLGELIAQCGLS